MTCEFGTMKEKKLSLQQWWKYFTQDGNTKEKSGRNKEILNLWDYLIMYI